MHLVAVLLNAVVSLAAAAFGVVALFRPERLSGSSTVSTGERYHARLFATRSIPFGIAVALLPFLGAHDVTMAFLVVAAAVQAADAVIGLQFGIRNEVVGGTLAAIVHAGTAIVLR